MNIYAASGLIVLAAGIISIIVILKIALRERHYSKRDLRETLLKRTDRRGRTDEQEHCEGELHEPQQPEGRKDLIHAGHI